MDGAPIGGCTRSRRVGSASADPQKGELLAIECDTLGSLDVVVFGNGRGSPGLVVDSTQVGIPSKLHIERTFTPTGGGDPETFVDEWDIQHRETYGSITAPSIGREMTVGRLSSTVRCGSHTRRPAKRQFQRRLPWRLIGRGSLPPQNAMREGSLIDRHAEDAFCKELPAMLVLRAEDMLPAAV